MSALPHRTKPNGLVMCTPSHLISHDEYCQYLTRFYTVPIAYEMKPTLNSPPHSTHNVIKQLQNDVLEAQDNLLQAKISQSVKVNKHCSLIFPFTVGSHVRLTTLHRQNKYKAKGEKHLAKFMPRFDGPYTVVNTDQKHSTVTIELPNTPNVFPTFHTSEILPFIENDTSLFPSHKFEEPLPILTPKGNEEYFIKRILDKQRRGRSQQYLVQWHGYRQEHNQWLPGSELQDCTALNTWLASRGETVEFM